MSSGREDWQNHRQDMQGNRQDWRDNHREDWQSWADHHIDHHGDWYHGCWHGGWYPGAGWGYMWNNYPVATAFGLTTWGVNRVAYGWGYWGYTNPYAATSVTYNYSQPIVVYSDGGNAALGSSATAPAAGPSEAGMTAFEEARAAFRDGDSAKALTLLDTTLKTMPSDTAVHEFRSLVLFSLKKYPEAAAAAYAVLAAGPGWDWTTMIGLYGEPDTYTKQLRSLEEFARGNPKSSDAHFLLGYHYLICSYAENASTQFKIAAAQTPNDKLLKQLIAMTTPPDESKSTEPPPVPASIAPEKVLKSEQLVGSWKATRDGATFQLELTKDGAFTWTYSRGNDKQSVKGAFAVDQNNLALEVDDGSVMLAEVDLTNASQFQFRMIGDDVNDPGLPFKKS